MTDTNSNDSIQQNVLDSVRAGKVRRRPRAYFVLRVIASLTVASLALLCSALVVSFILFSLHESGEQFLLGFGLRGVVVFLTLFPWLLALIAAVLLVLLECLVKGFRFSYRVPLLPIFFGMVGISVVLGAGISLTPLHSTLLGVADRGHLPLVGDAYEHIFDRHDDQGVCRGLVVSTTTDSFEVRHDDRDRDPDDGTFTIHLPPGSGLMVPTVGDYVLVFGKPGTSGSHALDAEHLQILSGVK